MVDFTRCTCSVPEEMTPKDLDNLLRVSKGMIDAFCFLLSAFCISFYTLESFYRCH
jgi:hypothetical protein